MKIAKDLLTVALSGLILSSTMPRAYAQTKINLDGQVIDQNKATISQAEVTLIDESGQSFVSKTDNQVAVFVNSFESRLQAALRSAIFPDCVRSRTHRL